MLVGRVFRVRVSPAQDAALHRWAGICRAVWNTGLEQRREYRRRGGFINYEQQCRELADAKTDFDLTWLADAPGHVLQQTLKDLDTACRKVGTWRVHWRSKTSWQPSMRFPEGKLMEVQRLSRRSGQVNLPKLGQVRFRMTRELGGRIRSATIRWQDQGWQISILVDDGVLKMQPPTPDPRPAVGVDRGVKVAVALSDGRMLDADYTTVAEQDHLVRLQQRLSRQHGPRVPGTRGRQGRRAPSKRWLRTKARIAAVHARQRRRRNDHLTKIARNLAAEHSIVAVENLNTSGMTRRPAAKPDPERPGAFLANRRAAKAGLNRAILGKGWGKFAEQLEHQARYTGTRVVVVPANFTSQRCHQCGHTEPGNRKNQADFRCLNCGHTANADTNAARNILDRALQPCKAAGHAASGRPSPDESGSVHHRARGEWPRNPRP